MRISYLLLESSPPRRRVEYTNWRCCRFTGLIFCVHSWSSDSWLCCYVFLAVFVFPIESLASSFVRQVQLSYTVPYGTLRHWSAISSPVLHPFPEGAPWFCPSRTEFPLVICSCWEWNFARIFFWPTGTALRGHVLISAIIMPAIRHCCFAFYLKTSVKVDIVWSMAGTSAFWFRTLIL
jgi:hypothetical protein